MNIACIGVNHSTADANYRGKVSFTESSIVEVANGILDIDIAEVIILSTCNRSEVYIGSKDNTLDNDIERVIQYLKAYFKLPDLEDHLSVKRRGKAKQHLYEVASGLDSIVLGEDQILGQIKEAQKFSMDIGVSGKLLNKCFREAISTAKRIKSEIKMSENPLSVSYIGMKFLKEKSGGFQGKNLVIIGSGEMGRLTLTYCNEEPLESIKMTNRSHKKVVDLLKDNHKLTAFQFEDRYTEIAHADILITTTSSPHEIIKQDKMLNRVKPLYILDMAIPKDVDNKVGELKDVYLYDVDDLRDISDKNLAERVALKEDALLIIGQEIKKLNNWIHNMKVDPVIKSINNKCNDIAEETLLFLNSKLNLDSKEQKLLEKMMTSALKKVVREPILNLKGIEDAKEQEKILEIFNMLFSDRRE